MGHAMLFPEDGGKGGRGKKDETRQSVAGFARETLRQARTVLRHSLAWAVRVRDGTDTLSVAYEAVKRGGKWSTTQVRDILLRA